LAGRYLFLTAVAAITVFLWWLLTSRHVGWLGRLSCRRQWAILGAECVFLGLLFLVWGVVDSGPLILVVTVLWIGAMWAIGTAGTRTR